jgi:putative transposase
MIVAFIDDNRDELGVEPICRVLQVAPSTYYAAKRRQPSARAVRGAVLMPALMVLWVANRRVYGALTSCGRRPAAPVTTSAGIGSPV